MPLSLQPLYICFQIDTSRFQLPYFIASQQSSTRFCSEVVLTPDPMFSFFSFSVIFCLTISIHLLYSISQSFVGRKNLPEVLR